VTCLIQFYFICEQNIQLSLFQILDISEKGLDLLLAFSQFSFILNVCLHFRKDFLQSLQLTGRYQRLWSSFSGLCRGLGDSSGFARLLIGSFALRNQWCGGDLLTGGFLRTYNVVLQWLENDCIWILKFNLGHCGFAFHLCQVHPRWVFLHIRFRFCFYLFLGHLMQSWCSLTRHLLHGAQGRLSSRATSGAEALWYTFTEEQVLIHWHVRSSGFFFYASFLFLRGHRPPGLLKLQRLSLEFRSSALGSSWSFRFCFKTSGLLVIIHFVPFRGLRLAALRRLWAWTQLDDWMILDSSVIDLNLAPTGLTRLRRFILQKTSCQFLRCATPLVEVSSH